MSAHTVTRTGTLWALSLAGLLAATTAFRPAPPPVHHTVRHDTVTLKVENDGFTDRIIYLVTQGGMRERIGTATAASTTTFTIPPTLLQADSYVWFAARKFAGFEYDWSPQTYLAPGDTVDMTIQSGLGDLAVTGVSVAG